MTSTAKLLTPPYNYAVVQLPERKFPGVVFQGDSLYGLVQSLDAVIAGIQDGHANDARDDLRYITEDLRDCLKSYETVCANLGLELPYPRVIWDAKDWRSVDDDAKSE
jgi:hypothetical protein